MESSTPNDNGVRASGGMEEGDAGREPWALPASASPGPFSSSSSSDSDGDEDDEGWAPFLAAEAADQRQLEEGSEVPSALGTLASIDVQDGGLDYDQPAMLSCRVLRLELPVTSESFLGVEKEELVVTCQLMVGDGAGDDTLDLLGASNPCISAAGVLSPSASPLPSPASSPSLRRPVGSGSGSGLRVASTRLPSSFRPAKGHVCWDQRLDIATVRLDRLLVPTTTGPARLRLMLWASTSSTLLGQVEVPLLLPPPPASQHPDGGDGDGGEQEEEATAPFSVLQLGVQRVAIPIFQSIARQPTPPGRRGSAIEPSSSSPYHQAHSRKRQLPPRWRRAASEPVRDEAAPSLSRLQLEDEDVAAVDGDDYVPRPFVWPAQGQLVIDVALLSTQGADERKEEAAVATAVSEASPLALAHALLAHPCDLLRREEAAVLWAQRQGLVQDGRALVKLLRALLAYAPFEEGPGGQGSALLEMWAAAGCNLTILDAMKLMGRHFSDPAVRGFALRQLERASDEDLEFHLLQLVQLLRYEPWAEARGGGGGAGGGGGTAAEEPLQSMNMPPLARFLIDRACGSLALGNALFWFLTAEMQTDRLLGRTFESVRFAFLYTLNGRDAPAYVALSAQEGWLKRIFKAYQRVLDAPGLRERKQTMLRELLAEDGLARPALPAVPLPLDPSLRTTGLDPTSACVYGSKTYPAFLSFALEGGAGTTTTWPPEEATEQQHEQSEKVLIFKMREDLRQDQLVLQLIRLMNGLLKARGLDLCLTPYRVLATGQQEGVVEYVPGAVTIADVVAASTRYNSSGGTSSSRILAFFQHHRPSLTDPLGVEPAVLNAYIRSLAGYCVATHLLGVGDRHLHNIMLCPSGHLFHLDFGFILGRDPKPVPRGPFRLSPAMVDGMGGREHPNFAAFKRLCVQAFACLRGHARLLLGLLDLMVDANLKDLCPNPTPVAAASAPSASMPTVERAQSLVGSLGLSQQQPQPQPPPPPHQHPDAARVLARMERRFRLDLGDDEAAIEQHFVGLIHKALGALGPQVVEVLHNLAVIAK